jgi:hypothetical protein
VRVSGGLDVRAQRALGEVQVSVPDGLQGAPARVQAGLEGPRRALDRVFPAGVRAVVRRDSLPAVLPPGGVDAPLVFEGLPPGVTARATPARVRVHPPGAAPAAPPADSQPRTQP